MSMLTITDIQKFSIHDGPGIRTTVFLKGCPLRCKWCHNPETLQTNQQLYLKSVKCISCQKCTTVCPNGVHTFTATTHFIDNSKCKACSLCVTACPTRALEIKGYPIGKDQLVKELLKDVKYYQNTNGGVTFSGGECLLQAPALLPILQELKSLNIHIAIETTLHIHYNYWKALIPYIDLFIVDYKHYDHQKLKEYTNGNLTLIEDNLNLLSTKDIIIRCPFIPTINDDEKHIQKLSLLSQQPNVIGLELLPYHTIGINKYKSLGLSYELNCIHAPTEADRQRCISLLKKYDAQNVKYDGDAML